jgi:alpha-amylase
MNMSTAQDNFRNVNLYFQVHQPRRLRKFQFSEIGSDLSCFDDKLNAAIIKRIAEECYLPANRLLLDLIQKFPQVKFTFSISGSTIDLLSEYAPHVIKSFQELAHTGAIEFISETYYHSLSCLIDNSEFKDQIRKHQKTIGELFGKRPSIFRNTDLIYSDSIGQTVFDMGFEGVYVEGVESVLNGRTAHHLYKHPNCDLVLFPRDYGLSDDIAFGFSNKEWAEWPLTADKFFSWIRHGSAMENFIGLGLAYETFGEHKKYSEGIFDFLGGLITTIAESQDVRFVHLSEARERLRPQGVVSTEKIISWADKEKNLSAWLGGELQRTAFDSLSKLYPIVKNIRNSKLMREYRYLQGSDHFYYMSSKNSPDAIVHDAVSPYSSSHEAFRNYLNILGDFEIHLKNELKKRTQLNGHGLSSSLSPRDSSKKRFLMT